MAEDQRPALVLVSEEHLETRSGQFARYEREGDVRAPRSAHEAKQVALFVVESVRPDVTVYEAIASSAGGVPTARRVVVAHWDRLGKDAAPLRGGLALGEYDGPRSDLLGGSGSWREDATIFNRTVDDARPRGVPSIQPIS